MAEKELIMRCGHCSNETVFKQIAQHLLEEKGYSDLHTSWHLLECVTCSKPTLIQIDPDETFEDRIILYPTAKTHLANIPVKIEKEYQATLKVRYINSNACAVLARRTLEAICTQENAQGSTLADKVNDLIQSDRIPHLVADMAHVGRKIGNMGAHFDQVEVTEYELSIMLDFLETILEYLYVLPAKVGIVKAMLKWNS